MKSSRRVFLKLGVAGLAGLAVRHSLSAQRPSGQRPNIALLLSDDHGWRDVGCYGSPDVKTPNLDRMAREGMRFTRAFTASPLCGPTRAQLYTGMYPVQSHACFNHPNHYVKEGVRTLPARLKALGYRVGIVGKIDAGPVEAYPLELLQRGEEVEFMTRDARQPFCLVFGFGQPHWPWGAGPAYDPARITVPPHLVDTPETRAALAAYYGDVTALDEEVGEALRVLNQSGLAGETLCLWSSEHGAGFPFSKATLYDNGMKLAFIARWPGRIEPGSVTGAMVHHVDVLPTLVEAAGGVPDGMDGSSFLPVLLGETGAHHEVVYGCLPDIRAVRTGRFKLIRNLAPDEPGNPPFSPLRDRSFGKHMGHARSWVPLAEQDPRVAARIAWFRERPPEELYDMENDPSELVNLADDPAHAETLERMRALLDAWMAEQGDQGRQTTQELKRWQRRQHDAGKGFLRRSWTEVVYPGK